MILKGYIFYMREEQMEAPVKVPTVDTCEEADL